MALASESATAAGTTTFEDCCEVCIVAPRAGFALVLCGHRTRKSKKVKSNYFIVRPKVSDVVLGLGPWSLVVLKDKFVVLGPGLGLEPWVLGPGLGLAP